MTPCIFKINLEWSATFLRCIVNDTVGLFSFPVCAPPSAPRRSVLRDSQLPHLHCGLVAALGFVTLLTGCGSGGTSQQTQTPSVTVSGASQVRLGSATTFTATVSNLANIAVTWQVNSIAGGNTTLGTINAPAFIRRRRTFPRRILSPFRR